MKSKKHTKKAVTLLTKIETLLSDVFDECSKIEKSVEKNVGVLLRSAEVSIAAAKDYFAAPELPKVPKKIARIPGRVPRHRVARSKAKATVAKKRSIGPIARHA
ncbi:MAG: hypothetical protein ABSG13_27850 [Bryobacteraceae bacterium]|jgi:hypothetical protein